MGIAQPTLSTGQVDKLERFERSLDFRTFREEILPDVSLIDRANVMLRDYESARNDEEFIDRYAKTYTSKFEKMLKSKLQAIERGFEHAHAFNHAEYLDKNEFRSDLKYELSDTGISEDEVLQKFGTKEWKNFKKTFVERVKGLRDIETKALEAGFQAHKFAKEYADNQEALWKYPQYQLETLVEELHDVRPDDFGRIQLDEKSFVDPNSATIVSDNPEETSDVLKKMGYDRLSNFVIHKNEYTLDDSAVFNLGDKAYTLGDVRGFIGKWKSREKLSREENIIASAAFPYIDRTLDRYSAGELEKKLNKALSLEVDVPNARISKRGKLLSGLMVAGAIGLAGIYVLSGVTHVIPTTSTTTSTTSTSSLHTSSIQSPLANDTVYQILRHNVMDDSRISGNRSEILNVIAVPLFKDLHYGSGEVKVLDPKTGSYVSKYISIPDIQAMANYSVAVYSGLPRHSNNILFFLGNASEIDSAIVDAKPIVVPTADGNITIVTKYLPSFYWMLTDQLGSSPYVLKHPELFEAIDSKVRQEEFVYTTTMGLSPADPTVRKLTQENWNYHWQAVPQEGNTSKRITILPWYDSAKMSQWFPNKADRQLIEEQMWLPLQLAQYNAKTGNLSATANLQTIKDNLGMIINGSQFGSFNGILYDRIMKAWNDKTMNSYNYAHTDNFIAWDAWNSRNGKQLGTILTDLKPQADTFEANYKPIINETLPINKLAFAYGLSTLDQAVRGIAEQYDVMQSMIYAKALGGAVFQDGIIRTAPEVQGYTHQTVAIPVPEFLASKLPTDTIYGPGHAVSLASSDSANIQSGTPYVTRLLPDGSNVKMKIYNSG